MKRWMGKQAGRAPRKSGEEKRTKFYTRQGDCLKIRGNLKNWVKKVKVMYSWTLNAGGPHRPPYCTKPPAKRNLERDGEVDLSSL